MPQDTPKLYPVVPNRDVVGRYRGRAGETLRVPADLCRAWFQVGLIDELPEGVRPPRSAAVEVAATRTRPAETRTNPETPGPNPERTRPDAETDGGGDAAP